jgi:pSer/pThr/pTyr-binding forkhead associated (FHA) protein
MPKLIITKDGEPHDEIIIENENTTIGRAPDCDVILDDAMVSRHHLRIICILGDCFLEDLNSANGTMVNKRLTNKCPLEHGDTITIGGNILKYDATSASETPEEEFNKTRVQLIKQLSKPEEPDPVANAQLKFTGDIDIQDSTVKVEHVQQEPSEPINISVRQEVEPNQEPTQSRVKAENPKDRVGNMTIMSGARQGHNMPLTKSVTSIDKSGQKVAAVTKRPDGYFLVPLGDGSPGTVSVVINGEEINRKIFPLWSNDVIELDGTEMVFEFSD